MIAISAGRLYAFRKVAAHKNCYCWFITNSTKLNFSDICKFKGLPKAGALSDVFGVLSDTISMKTEKARRIVTLNESFSPDSVGTMEVIADKSARTTVGMIKFKT